METFAMLVDLDQISMFSTIVSLQKLQVLPQGQGFSSWTFSECDTLPGCAGTTFDIFYLEIFGKHLFPLLPSGKLT